MYSSSCSSPSMHAACMLMFMFIFSIEISLNYFRQLLIAFYSILSPSPCPDNDPDYEMIP